MATLEPMTRDEFGGCVHDELEACRVSRDHPVHRLLVEGGFTLPMLHELGRQQWAFHRAFPTSLALLAGGCPDPALRQSLLASAYEQETGGISGTAGRLELWERVCATWGLTPADLEASRPLPTTEAMNALQEYVARRPFGEAAAGLLIAVAGEAAPFMAARRAAMAAFYGVPEPALVYFTVQAAGDPVEEYAEIAYRYSATRIEQAAALRALRLVLHARWDYFSGIGRASELAGGPGASPGQQ